MRKRVVFVGTVGLSAALGVSAGCDLLQGLKPATMVETGGGGQGGDAGAGGTSTGGTGSGTTATVCEPGTTIACYTGPDGTEGVATCKGGVRACLADGSGYETVCQGEVLPTPETCMSAEDEDCDKLDCVRWAAIYGDSYEQRPLDIATDLDGNAYIVGTFSGAIDLVDPPLVSAGERDLFLAQIAPDGKVMWAKRFGNAVDQQSASIAVDSEGNVVLAGTFEGTLSFGGEILSAQGFDVYVAKLDNSGAHLWSNRFGDSDTQNVIDVKVDVDQNVLLTGSFRGGIDFGAGVMTASCCDFDVYVAKLGSDGMALWSKSFGDAANQSVSSASTDSSGSLVVFGSFSGTMDFGGGSLVAGASDSLFAARLDGGGGYGWAKKFSGGSFGVGPSASDDSGNIVLLGAFAGSVDFGGGAVASDGNGLDLFMTKMTSTGFYQWAKVLPTTGASNFSSGIAVDRDGNLVATTWGSGTVDFGGGVLGDAGQDSIYLAKLSSDGEHLWSRRAPGRNSVVAIAPDGDVVFAGKVSGTIDVGTGPLVTKGQDLLIARFAP